MNRFLQTALLLILIPAGCRTWDNPFDPINPGENHAPNKPSDPQPDSGVTGYGTEAVLHWTGGDPDSDAVLYDVYFGTAAQPPRVMAGIDSTSHRVTGLAYTTLYRWRIVSRDEHGDSTAGPLWTFETRAETDTNHPPNTPSDPQPANGASGQDTGATLTWTGGDPDTEDVVTYDVYFSTFSPPGLAQTGLTSASFHPGNLGFLTQYYWRVKSRDNRGDSAVGPIWGFETRAPTDTNQPPNQPSGPSPANGATGQRLGTTLGWTCSDPDPGDTLKYDVYFGTTTPPPLAAQNLIQASYNPGPLGYYTFYYWRITARDNHGAANQGPEWNFRTLAQVVVTSPAAGTRWQNTSTQTIEWTGGSIQQRRPPSGLLTSPDKWNHAGAGPGSRQPAVSGLPDAADSAVIYYSTDNGANWTRHGKATQPGEYQWSVPGPETDSALVEVRSYVGGEPVAGRSARFQMYDLPSAITVTQPTTGTRWREGSAESVTWTGGTLPDMVDSTVVSYSTDDGGTWLRHGLATTPGRYDWNVPGPAAQSARVRVKVHVADKVVSGTSFAYEVYDSLAPSPITVTAPAGGAQWEVGTQHQVTWTGGTFGYDSSVVFYSPDSGQNWTRQGRVQNQGTFDWTVPEPVTKGAQVRITAYNAARTTQGLSGIFEAIEPRYPDSVIASVSVGAKPRALAWNSSADRVYVSCRDGDTVAVIDGVSNAVIARIAVGDLPGAALYVSAANKLYVANEGSATVSVINCATNAVVKTLSVGVAPRALAWNRAGSKVYVANWSGNSVSVIDVGSDSVVKTIAVGQRPVSLAWNPVVNKVYATCSSTNQLTVIDGAADTVITNVPTGFNPSSVVVDSTHDEVYFTNQNSGTVGIVDGVTNMSLGTINVFYGPCMITWNPVANRVYSADKDGDNVSVINTETHQVVVNATVGDEPRSLLWASLVNVVYVMNYLSDNLTVLSGRTGLPVKTIAVGDEPLAACWNLTDRKVYVANYAAGTVSVLGQRP